MSHPARWRKPAGEAEALRPAHDGAVSTQAHFPRRNLSVSSGRAALLLDKLSQVWYEDGQRVVRSS